MKLQSSQNQVATEWILQRQVVGTTMSEAIAFFDALPPITLDEMIGRWHGSGLPTGHPLDGLLESTGWYGKEFIDTETVYPLLFTAGKGKRLHLDSRYLPFGLITRLTPFTQRIAVKLFPIVRGLLRTNKARARLRMMEYRQKVSATMIYDFLPIHDVFRRLDANTVIGLMDQKGQSQVFFFVLRREV
jgi:hypothetical protein